MLNSEHQNVAGFVLVLSEVYLFSPPTSTNFSRSTCYYMNYSLFLERFG